MSFRHPGFSTPLALAAVLIVPCAWGQATDSGSVALQVSDSSQAVLPGAQLILTDKATNVIRTAETLKAGGYTFQSLPYGHYRLTVTRDGFETASFDDVTVRSGVSTRIEVKLKVGSTTAVVEVSGQNTPVIEASSNTLSTTIDLQQVQNLPIGGRDLTQLAYLVPGYASTGANGSTNATGTASDGTFSGMAQSTVSANIDGVNTTSSRFKSGYGFASTVSPRVENIQELTVQTGELDPSQGAGQSSAQILFVTDRGTNKIHGRIFEDHQNAWLNANSWTNNAYKVPKGKLIINSFGANVGGPVLRDKLFLFVDYSQLIQPRSVAASAVLPTPAAAMGIYTYYNNCTAANGTQCSTSTINVYNVAQQNGFSGTPNSIVAAQLAKNFASTKYGSLTTSTADLNTETLSWNQSARTENYYPAGRLDWTISKHHSLNLSANYNKNMNTGSYPSQFPGPDFASQVSGNASRRYVISLGEDWTVTPNLLNQLRAGYLYTSSVFSPEFNGQDVTKMSSQGWAFGTSGVVATTSQTSFYPYMTLSDNVLFQKGTHSFKFGGNIFHQQDHYYNPPVGYPNYYLGVSYNDPVSTPLINSVPTSGGAVPGDANTVQAGIQNLYGTLAGRITGVYSSFAYKPSSGTYGAGAFNLNEVTLGGGLFALDSWRIRPGLTLNYGLRWDLISAVRDKNNAYTGPDISSLWGPSGVGNLFRPGVLSGNQDPTFVARSSVYNPSLINPEPQVGLAWNPAGVDGLLGHLIGANKTVVRASFTLKNYTEGGQNFWRYASNYGYNFFQSAYLYPDTSGVSGSYQPGSLTLGGAIPAYGLSPSSFQRVIHMSTDVTFSGQSGAAIDPNIRQPYVESWTLGLQRQFGRSSALEVRYVGNHSVHSWISEDLNQVNIQENGFLTEFKNAQSNLAINQASGRAAGDFENHGNGKPIPLITQAFGGAGAADFTNGTFATFLRNGAAGSFASQLAQSPNYFCNVVGSNFSPCAGVTNVAGSAYPINYFQANPYLAGTSAQYLSSSGTANYNSLQVDFRQQAIRGLELDVNYTYAKTLGISTQRSIDNTGNYYDLHHKSLNYQPSAFDIRNTFHGSGTYSLPFGKGRALLSSNQLENLIFGGFTFGTIVQYQTGTPSILTGGYSTVNGAADSGVDFPVGSSASVIQKSTKITSNPGNPYKNFLPAQYRGSAHANYAYVTPHADAGSFGHLNFLYGPKWINTDMALTKAFPIRERLMFNLQGEFLNIFNHPAFGIGDTGVQDGTFGTTNSLVNAPRRVEIRGNITF